jgi:hypothetical protein
MLLCPGRGRGGGSRCRKNILVPRADGWHPRAGASNFEIGGLRRAGHPAKIYNRNGSRSSLLSFSVANRRVPPLVFVIGTTADSTAAAGSRAPLGDPVLLFELF